MSKVSVYQIFVALTVLYLAMRYVPGGKIIGWIILLAVVLSSPNALDNVQGLLCVIQGKKYDGGSCK